MKVKVVGYKACDFPDKNGTQVQGVSLKCVCDSSDEDLVGQDVQKIWLSKKLIENVGFVPDVGTNVNLIYDYDGRKAVLSDYQVIEEPITIVKEDKPNVEDVS